MILRRILPLHYGIDGRLVEKRDRARDACVDDVAGVIDLDAQPYRAANTRAPLAFGKHGIDMNQLFETLPFLLAGAAHSALENAIPGRLAKNAQRNFLVRWRRRRHETALRCIDASDALFALLGRRCLRCEPRRRWWRRRDALIVLLLRRVHAANKRVLIGQRADGFELTQPPVVELRTDAEIVDAVRSSWDVLNRPRFDGWESVLEIERR